MKEKKEGLKFKPYLTRTIWIGLAFFGILLVWQLYNSYCSPMLAFMFARHDYAGIVEKAIAEAASDAKVDMIYLLKMGYLTENEFLDVQWKVGIIMALDNIAALVIMPIFGAYSDRTRSKLGKRMPYILVGSVVTAIVLPLIPLFFSYAMVSNAGMLMGMVCGMILTMVIIIIFMMSYRSPAVALMPDLTPKPLRTKANGIINIVGYVGGAIGSIFAMIFAVTSYLDGSMHSLFMLEIPFVVSSIILVVSLVILLTKVRENKLHSILDDEIRRYEDSGESAEIVTKTEKLSKKNLRNLILILIAEVFWFMALNAVETFQTNYVMFWCNTSSSGGAVMVLISGAASVIGFLVAGLIADKIGRKWTIFIGIGVVMLCYIIYAFIPKASAADIEANPFGNSLPWIFFILLPTIGLGTSLIHICSFPLVTDYCTSDKLGRFTSLYYTASMLAQSVTPILIGFIFRLTSWNALPIYSAILMGVAGLVFFFVQTPKVKSKNAKGLDALGADD